MGKIRIQDSGFRIQDSGFRVQDSGFRVVHGAVFDVNDGLTTQTSFVRRLGGEADYPARVPERVMPFSSSDAERVKR
jgi:hypothetical protein